MSLPKYPEYKDSSIDSLGVVPKSWSITRSDALLTSSRRQIEPSEFAEEEVFHYSIPSVQAFGTGSIESGAEISSAKQLIEKKVVLVSKLNPRKATTCIAEPQSRLTLCSTEFVSLEPRKVSIEYLAYLVQGEGFRQSLESKVMSVTNSHQRAEPSDIYRFWMALPSQPEQQNISVFLDRETAKIDELVAEQEWLIERLKEKRQAVISHAVTKGLDPRVPMKAAGFDWLEQVPSHWRVMRFQRCVFVAEGQVDPKTATFSAMKLIAPDFIESGTGRLLPLETAEDQGAISGKYLCRRGEVVYSKIRPALRKVCVAPEDCLCSADMYPLRAHNGLENEFLFWLILSEHFSAFAVLESERVAMPKINRESLKKVVIALPPVPEQIEIVAHIKAEISRVDGLIFEAKDAIGLLQERRSALISAAVTGQIDVRHLETA